MPITRDNITYDSPYGDVAGINDAFNSYVEHLGAMRSDSEGNRKQILSQYNDVATNFKNQFKNLVGRDASQEELQRFFSDSGVLQALPGSGGLTNQGIRNQITQFIGDTFQDAANQTAQDKLAAQESKYASLADSYLEMGKKSLGNLADELKSYQVSLFEKLRPQLNLAAQAGGYADSGGQTLQEQGALKDLGNDASRYLADKGYEIETNANNIRYGGKANPVSLATQFAMNQPFALTGRADTARGLADTNWMRNQDYLRELQLAYGKQKWAQDSQPGFWTGLGQNLATGAIRGLTNGLGSGIQQDLYRKYGGGGGGVEALTPGVI